MKKSSPAERNSINIGNLMRKHSKLRVSPEAVKAMIDRVELFLENNMKLIDGVAIKNKRKTVFDSDIDIFFSFPSNDIEDIKVSG